MNGKILIHFQGSPVSNRVKGVKIDVYNPMWKLIAAVLRLAIVEPHAFRLPASFTCSPESFDRYLDHFIVIHGCRSFPFSRVTLPSDTAHLAPATPPSSSSR
jgi:hypothetical protein